ncbi:hypothetical protein SteCoe_8876 [Stentor coeruleus]|uniref:G-protein coupled receptors family 2 profile 2 domain-containing protein n=1 Tax=Stentor coeruleus TaxID=5963 RepID=A0A1R2CJ43_9CILI|nr:hypothetical protein SteCoe_8876 [Stentor coeruleus]
MDQNSKEQEILTLTLTIANIFSSLGSIFIIVAYVTMKKSLFSLRLVVYMTIADLLHSISLIIPPTSNTLCLIQGILLQFTSASSVLWSAIMAFSIFNASIRNDNNVEGKENIFLVVGYIFPLILTILPVITDSYGYSQGWCWIKPADHGVIWRLVCFYAVLFFVIIFNLSVYGFVYGKIRQEILNIPDEEAQKVNRDLLTRLKFYPIILIFCYTTVTIMRMCEMFNSNINIFWFTLASGLSVSLLGLLNSIAYGLSKDVREHLKFLLCKKKTRHSSPFDPNPTTGSINS